jgi:hypothetical protein
MVHVYEVRVIVEGVDCGIDRADMVDDWSSFSNEAV